MSDDASSPRFAPVFDRTVTTCARAELLVQQSASATARARDVVRDFASELFRAA